MLSHMLPVLVAIICLGACIYMYQKIRLVTIHVDDLKRRSLQTPSVSDVTKIASRMVQQFELRSSQQQKHRQPSASQQQQQQQPHAQIPQTQESTDAVRMRSSASGGDSSVGTATASSSH